MLRTLNTAEAYHCRGRKARLFHDLERICLCFFGHAYMPRILVSYATRSMANMYAAVLVSTECASA